MIEKLLYRGQQIRRKASKKMKVLNTVELSKSALVHNYKYFKKLHKESEICPVLKSNAYGHGLKEIALMCDDLNAPFIVVDSYYEALELKKIGIKTPILIIGYTHPDNYKDMKFSGIAITVLDKETIEALGKLRKKIKIHLKVDTGMHRQGIPFEEIGDALKLLKKYKKLRFEGVCTHLADADNPKSNKFTHEQVSKFKKALKIVEENGFNVKWKHISATAGAGKIFAKDFNMIRLGLGLYGDSTVKDFKKLRPVLTFKSTIIDLKTLKKGDSVSYGCTFKAPKKMRIGIIPAGYYEGIDRRLSNKGMIYYGKTQCQIIGRVCMNLTMIDLTNIKRARKWDKVEVIGKNVTVRQIAEICGTITYVIWTHIAPTIRRMIV